MTLQKPTTTYWNRKLEAYLHDPFDKVFHIPGHEDRASELLEIFGESLSNDHFWKDADIMAASLERGTVPGYSQRDLKSGAVDFSTSPIITHPTGTEQHLRFELPDSATPKKIIKELKESLRKFIGMNERDGGFSNKYRSNPDEFSVARFFFLHLALRFKLAEEDSSLLGQLWHRIPADSRFPDHSIWQHNQMVSAMNSCMEFVSENSDVEFKKARRENVGLTVFSISPVQGFIGKSRKLRDYHTSSILLSFLAFEGIKWVMENLGPDHILYPSLIDQPFVAEYMKKRWKLKGEDEVKLWNKHAKNIATFPNKFLFLSPINKEKEISEAIEVHIKNEWTNIVKKVEKFTKQKLKLEATDHYEKLWNRQNENFWEFSHATVKLVDLGDAEKLQELFETGAISDELQTAELFKEMSKELYPNSNNNPNLYGVAHSLAQSVLASEKSRKTVKRAAEPGEKCQLCGEFEVLHTENHENKSAREYSNHLNYVWKQINDEAGDADFKSGEKLCSICTVKRLLPQVIRADNSHLLHSVFKSNESFVSTPEMALSRFENRRELAKKMFNGEHIPHLKSKDKYYAILMMDGDKMGDLINGKTVGASWKSIIHPDIKEKLEGTNEFPDIIQKNWKKLLEKTTRNMIPSLHASISESLGDFAIYGVAPIVKKYKGTLIYAGGDDVAAIMPLATVLDAADEIRRYYIQSFRSIGLDGETSTDTKTPNLGKLSVGLGNAPGISISAGILICHHKESLSQMIDRAHALLDEQAKKEVGRNGCAIELKKRSGGSRYLSGKWNEFEKWKKEFDTLPDISTSLIYRLEKFRDGVEAILNHDETLLQQFFQKQLERSGEKEERAKELSEIFADITIYTKEDKKIFDPERLIVASYISKGGGR